MHGIHIIAVSDVVVVSICKRTNRFSHIFVFDFREPVQAKGYGTIVPIKFQLSGTIRNP